MSFSRFGDTGRIAEAVLNGLRRKDRLFKFEYATDPLAKEPLKGPLVAGFRSKCVRSKSMKSKGRQCDVGGVLIVIKDDAHRGKPAKEAREIIAQNDKRYTQYIERVEGIKSSGSDALASLRESLVESVYKELRGNLKLKDMSFEDARGTYIPRKGFKVSNYSGKTICEIRVKGLKDDNREWRVILLLLESCCYAWMQIRSKALESNNFASFIYELATELKQMGEDNNENTN